jgi:hypothetical protein
MTRSERRQYNIDQAWNRYSSARARLPDSHPRVIACKRTYDRLIARIGDHNASETGRRTYSRAMAKHEKEMRG